MKKRIRASIVCVHDGQILVFKAIDPHSGKSYLFLPGGGIEGDETPWRCGERETLEETGYRVRAIPKSEVEKNYFFEWNGVNYDCTTFFYKGVLAEEFKPPRPVVDAPYNLGARWVPLSEASKIFSYLPEVLEVILQYSD